MSGLLEIRPAHLGDAAGITAIYGHYVAHTVLTVDLKAPSVEDWQVRLASLAESGHHVLVAVEAGQVLGYALVTPWIAKPAFRHTAENSIYLAPGATGASRGRRLLKTLARGRAVRRNPPTPRPDRGERHRRSTFAGLAPRRGLRTHRAATTCRLEARPLG